MAKKKAKPKGKSVTSRGKRTKEPRASGWSRLFRFLFSSPVRKVLLIALVLAVIYWQWSALLSWGGDIVSGVWGLFGWGLALIFIALVVFISTVWQRKSSSFVRRFHKWLAGAAFALATWGILALLGLGGSLGLGIAGSSAVDFVSVSRLLALIVIGIVLVAPRPCFRLTAKFCSWLGRQFKRRPARVRVPQQKPTPPPITAVQKPVEVKQEKTPVPPTFVPAPELRQVAQEVWKKYGESPKIVVVDGWRLPPIDILDMSPEVEFSEADNLKRAGLIEDALASYGVEAKVVQINSGPTVTQFGVEPGWDRKIKEIRERDRDGNVRIRQEEVSRTRVKVDKITSLSNDLSLALAASSIRIEAPVPGKSVVGIEVPNTISSSVSLRGVIESSGFQKMQARSKLSLALGKGAGGEATAGDLTKMPHLLIAGATGSGKTVCLNSIICCLLLFNTPNDIKFIMIDPKRVELTPFNSIPHLAAPVIVDTDKALNVLRWLNKEMDKRYQILASSGARNIESHNRNRQSSEKLSYLVLVIDELADLMMTGFDEVEHILCRLAQLARATGIHLVVATQRPSVDVVTGLIKANFPTRISFAVTSQVDSRTILDITGAEKLLGRGDMLYMPTEAAKPKRLQGCYVSDAETERLVYFWGSQRKEEVAQLKLDEISVQSAATRREMAPPDSLLDAARQLAEEHKHISTSFLQRRLRIGYPRAARIMEQLEEEGSTGEEAE